MIDESTKERLRTLTVEVVLEMRAAYLRTSGVNILKHWDQIQERMRSAAKMTAGPEEWATAMARSLRLDAPSSRYSEALLALTHDVHEASCAGEWLDLLEREYAFLVVMARSCADKRKADAAALAAEGGA